MPKTDISILKGCIYAILTNCWKSKPFAKSSQTLESQLERTHIHTPKQTYTCHLTLDPVQFYVFFTNFFGILGE